MRALRGQMSMVLAAHGAFKPSGPCYCWSYNTRMSRTESNRYMLRNLGSVSLLTAHIASNHMHLSIQPSGNFDQADKETAKILLE